MSLMTPGSLETEDPARYCIRSGQCTCLICVEKDLRDASGSQGAPTEQVSVHTDVQNVLSFMDQSRTSDRFPITFSRYIPASQDAWELSKPPITTNVNLRPNDKGKRRAKSPTPDPEEVKSVLKKILQHDYSQASAEFKEGILYLQQMLDGDVSPRKQIRMLFTEDSNSAAPVYQRQSRISQNRNVPTSQMRRPSNFTSKLAQSPTSSMPKARQSRRISPGTEHIYQCTKPGCKKTFPEYYEWSRHERSVCWNIAIYMCLECDHVFSKPDGTYGCSFCSLSFLDVEKVRWHNLECKDAREALPTFPRKDKLLEHLRNDHDMQEMSMEADSWCFEVRNWPEECGFCGVPLKDWDSRADHIVYHFGQGCKVSDWKIPFPKRKYRPRSGVGRKPNNDNDDKDSHNDDHDNDSHGDDDDNNDSGGAGNLDFDDYMYDGENNSPADPPNQTYGLPYSSNMHGCSIGYVESNYDFNDPEAHESESGSACVDDLSGNMYDMDGNWSDHSSSLGDLALTRPLTPLLGTRLERLYLQRYDDVRIFGRATPRIKNTHTWTRSRPPAVASLDLQVSYKTPLLSSNISISSISKTSTVPSTKNSYGNISHQSTGSTLTSLSSATMLVPTLLPPAGYYLPCEFSFTGCQLQFHPGNTEAWITHSFSHFSLKPLPQKSICVFCDHTAGFFTSSGSTRSRIWAWRDRMLHIGDHIQYNRSSDNMRPDYLLLNHLWEHNIISQEDYELANNFTERPCLDFLLPFGSRLEEQKKKGQCHDLAKEKRQIRKERQRVTGKRKENVVLHLKSGSLAIGMAKGNGEDHDLPREKRDMEQQSRGRFQSSSSDSPLVKPSPELVSRKNVIQEHGTTTDNKPPQNNLELNLGRDRLRDGLTGKPRAEDKTSAAASFHRRSESSEQRLDSALIDKAAENNKPVQESPKSSLTRNMSAMASPPQSTARTRSSVLSDTSESSSINRISTHANQRMSQEVICHQSITGKTETHENRLPIGSVSNHDKSKLKKVIVGSQDYKLSPVRDETNSLLKGECEMRKYRVPDNGKSQTHYSDSMF
jgi:hypothetical protein